MSGTRREGRSRHFPGNFGRRRRSGVPLRLAGLDPVPLWHASDDLRGVDAVVLPGGFSYGDYLRCGAIAALAPVMRSVVEAAAGGLPVLGICNGFQVLCESHLLPGALIRNSQQRFICREQELVAENTNTAWTSGFSAGEKILIPLKNGEGNFQASAETVAELECRGARCVPLLRGQSQRLDQRYRGHLQCRGQRGGSHASPGACG